GAAAGDRRCRRNAPSRIPSVSEILKRSHMQSLKIICPNGHLGFAPLRTASFQLGVEAGPHYIDADSGRDQRGLKKFRLGYFYSEVDPQYLRAKIRAGDKVLGLDGRPDLTEPELDATQR